MLIVFKFNFIFKDNFKNIFLPSSNENYFQNIVNIGYEGLNLYVADPQYPDRDYAYRVDLQEIDLNSTAGQILQRNRNLFPSVRDDGLRPLVVLKMRYVRRNWFRVEMDSLHASCLLVDYARTFTSFLFKCSLVLTNLCARFFFQVVCWCIFSLAL